MDAITILKNESNNHRLMQIDLDVLADNEEQLEDVYDIIAVELRKNVATAQAKEFCTLTRQFDLLQTLPSIKAKTLIQFADNDPWIDSLQAKRLESALHDHHQVEWLDDDHTMNAPASLQQRKVFIKTLMEETG